MRLGTDMPTMLALNSAKLADFPTLEAEYALNIANLHELQKQQWLWLYSIQGAPKERRLGRAEKRLSKRVFLESPFLLCSLKVFRTFQVF